MIGLMDWNVSQMLSELCQPPEDLIKSVPWLEI